MKNKILTLCFAALSFNSFSQGTSFYSIESEYTTTFGYRYFFNKTNTATGISTQLSQLPIAGYSLGSKFFNCYGNYVFCGVDSSTTSTPYLFKLFEVDTLGNVVRTLPVSSASGAGPDLIHFNRSFSSQMYYGIIRNGYDRDYVSIDPISGATTVIASITLPYHMITPISVMAPGNNFYFVEQNNMSGDRILYKADYTSGTITATDSALSPNDFVNLAYDCVQDSVVGFYTPFPYNVNGAEWIKIDNTNGKVRYTGTFFSGSGSLYSTGFTILNGGDYYAKIYSNSGIMFDPASVSGATYTPFATYLNPLDLKLISAPEKHCTNYYSCSSLSVNETVSESEGIKIYPNPFTENTTFVIHYDKLNETYSFELTDVLGKRVRAVSGITEKQFQLSREGLKNGIYFYKIYSSENLIGVGKLVVE